MEIKIFLFLYFIDVNNKKKQYNYSLQNYYLKRLWKNLLHHKKRKMKKRKEYIPVIPVGNWNDKCNDISELIKWRVRNRYTSFKCAKK